MKGRRSKRCPGIAEMRDAAKFGLGLDIAAATVVCC